VGHHPSLQAKTREPKKSVPPRPGKQRPKWGRAGAYTVADADPPAAAVLWTTTTTRTQRNAHLPRAQNSRPSGCLYWSAGAVQHPTEEKAAEKEKEVLEKAKGKWRGRWLGRSSIGCSRGVARGATHQRAVGVLPMVDEGLPHPLKVFNLIYLSILIFIYFITFYFITFILSQNSG
jgi:hypothetical protein